MAARLLLTPALIIVLHAQIIHAYQKCVYHYVKLGHTYVKEYTCFSGYRCCGGGSCCPTIKHPALTYIPIYRLWYFWIGLVLLFLLIGAGMGSWYRKRYLRTHNVLKVHPGTVMVHTNTIPVRPPPYACHPPPYTIGVPQHPPSYSLPPTTPRPGSRQTYQQIRPVQPAYHMTGMMSRGYAPPPGGQMPMPGYSKQPGAPQVTAHS